MLQFEFHGLVEIFTVFDDFPLLVLSSPALEDISLDLLPIEAQFVFKDMLRMLFEVTVLL